MWFTIPLLLGLAAGNVEFLPKMGGYDYSTAMDALYYSSSAYCSKQSILDWNCGIPCDQHPDFEVLAVYKYSLYNDTEQCYVGIANGKNQVVISFEGTHDPF